MKFEPCAKQVFALEAARRSAALWLRDDDGDFRYERALKAICVQEPTIKKKE